MKQQPDTSECQIAAGQSSTEDSGLAESTNQPSKICGNKCHILTCGMALKCHEEIRNHLQTLGLKEVSVKECDVIVVFCTVVSRAGTDIEAALIKLNGLSGSTPVPTLSWDQEQISENMHIFTSPESSPLSLGAEHELLPGILPTPAKKIKLTQVQESKPAIFMVLHHTFDPEKIVLDSSRCVNRPNTLTLDFLFNEDTGLLQCMKNKDALDRIQQCLQPQVETQMDNCKWTIISNKEIEENVTEAEVASLPNSQAVLNVESEHMIVLLGMSGSGKNTVGNMLREEMDKPGVDTAIHKITVESGTVAGEKVSLIDTPDWFSSGLSLENIKENVERCIRMCNMGPYAVLLVIPLNPVDDKGTEMVRNMKMIFEERCCEKVMIIFIKDDQEKRHDFIKQQGLQKLVENCENRFCSLHITPTGKIDNFPDMLKMIEVTAADFAIPTLDFEII